MFWLNKLVNKWLKCVEKQTKNNNMDNILTKTDILPCVKYSFVLQPPFELCLCYTTNCCLQLHMWVDQRFRDVSDVKESRRNFHTSRNRWQDLTANPQRHGSVSPRTLLTFLLQDKWRISSRILNVSYTNTPSVGPLSVTIPQSDRNKYRRFTQHKLQA